jgi:hypothetical protein
MITQTEREKVKDLIDKGVLTPGQADELMEALCGDAPMSKAEHPCGSRYVFSDNEIKMGKLTDITLNDSEMKGRPVLCTMGQNRPRRRP